MILEGWTAQLNPVKDEGRYWIMITPPNGLCFEMPLSEFVEVLDMTT